MGVAAARGVFHKPGITWPEHLLAPVAHADLHFSTQRGDVEQLRQRSRALHFLAVIDH